MYSVQSCIPCFSSVNHYPVISFFRISECFLDFFFYPTAKCIDSYTGQRVHKAENPDEDITIDPRLEAIVDRMFKRCFDDGKYKQVDFEILLPE